MGLTFSIAESQFSHHILFLVHLTEKRDDIIVNISLLEKTFATLNGRFKNAIRKFKLKRNAGRRQLEKVTLGTAILGISSPKVTSKLCSTVQGSYPIPLYLMQKLLGLARTFCTNCHYLLQDSGRGLSCRLLPNHLAGEVRD